MPTEWLRTLSQLRPLWLPVADESPHIILSCQASISRNLQNLPFPPFAKHDENASKAGLILRSEISRLPEWTFGRWLDSQTLPTVQRLFLLEQGRVPVSFCIPRHDCFVLPHPNGHSHCFINDRDHLSVNSWRESLNLTEAYNDCLSLIDSLKGRLSFAENDYYGYLCRDVNLCGAGTKLEIFLHLPALALCDNSDEDDNKISQVAAACRDNGFFFSNMSHHPRNAAFILGSGHIAVDAVPETITKIVAFAKHIVNCELQERRRLAKYDRTCLLDVVDRAYGLAKHARQMEIAEYHRCLSALWLGCEEDMFRHIDCESLQELFGAAGMATITVRQNQTEQSTTWSDEICVMLRVELLREKLQLPDRP